MTHMSEIQKKVQEFRDQNPIKVKKPRKPARKAWRIAKPEEFEAAKILRSEGHSIAKLANHFKVGIETIRKNFAYAGVPSPVKRVSTRSPKGIQGPIVNPGSGCPCGAGMKEICTVHKGSK